MPGRCSTRAFTFCWLRSHGVSPAAMAICKIPDALKGFNARFTKLYRAVDVEQASQDSMSATILAVSIRNSMATIALEVNYAHDARLLPCFAVSVYLPW